MTDSDDAREALTRVIGALGTGALLADERGFIVAVNAHAERLLRRPASELVDRDAHDLLHRTSRGETVPRDQCRMRQSVLGGRTEHGGDEWLRRGDGTLLPVAWLATPYDPGVRAQATLVLFHPRTGRPGEQSQGGGNGWTRRRWTSRRSPWPRWSSRAWTRTTPGSASCPGPTRAILRPCWSPGTAWPAI
nr:PAS domain-containing protein [Streptomyces collinus]